jgi:outer membrane protein OmpA-like peptidoglycan-associated protein
VDRCPLKPEDPDGWEDQDGCPDLDNDGDGILDAVDRCPNAPETWNGHEDEDGCPDTKSIEPSPASVVPERLPSDAPTDEQLRLTRQLSDLVSSMRAASVAVSTGEVDPQADWDEDGVGDLHDRCPEIKEDVDGWQDEDGCPDLDNDGDGIPDVRDTCSNAAETWNGYLDEDGCPDQRPAPESKVSAEAPQPEPSQEPQPSPEPPPNPELPSAPQLLLIVYFPSGGSALDPLARGSLDELVLELHQHPGRSLEVVGYSDSRGGASGNLRLSRERAQRVVEHLTEAGIARERLSIVARGEEDPLADNASLEGRARNRRVEIRFLPANHDKGKER